MIWRMWCARARRPATRGETPNRPSSRVVHLFTNDQIDLDFRNPEVLLESADHSPPCGPMRGRSSVWMRFVSMEADRDTVDPSARRPMAINKVELCLCGYAPRKINFA